MANCSNNKYEADDDGDDSRTDHKSSPIEQFQNLRSDLERVNFAYEMDFDKYPASMDRDEKTDGFATIYIEHGDELLFQGKVEESIKYHTCAIANAKSKEVTAVAYSKRAKVLFEMDLYKECATDIRRSFAYDSEISNKPDLLELLEDAERSSTIGHRDYCEDPPSLENHNRRIECASDLVEIRTDPDFGRSIIAKKDINFGEILCVERPYVGMVKNLDFFHCQNCLRLCYNLIPCICTLALYCCNDCRFEAFEKYHKYECQISGLLKWNHQYMHDRSVFMAVKATFLAMTETHNNFDEINCYRSDRFREIFDLVTNLDRRPVTELIAMAKFAAKTFHFVKKHTTFFRDLKNLEIGSMNCNNNFSNNEDLFKDTLMRLLQSFCVNSVKVFELICNPTEGCKVSSFASGIYPFFSMFNHSCVPNVFKHFYGATLVARSLRNIKKGEQCFTCYGPKFDLHATEERQIDLLKGYHFKCECEACRDEDWQEPLSKIPENFDYESLRKVVEDGDREAAKRVLPVVLEEIAKISQQEECLDNYQSIQELGRFCYDLLGNKRHDFTQ